MSTTRFRMSLVSVLGVIMVVVAFAAPATAAPYTHHRPTTSVSSSHPAAGSTITFCGAGFRPNETVTIKVNRTGYTSVTASSSGDWCTTVHLSPGLSGNVRLTASSTTSHRSSSTRIRIDKPHGHNGRGHGDEDRDRGSSEMGGSSWLDRVLGLSVMGGSSWIDRVPERW